VVVAQNPPPGERIERGKKVTISVSRPPPTAQPKPKPKPVRR